MKPAAASAADAAADRVHQGRRPPLDRVAVDIRKVFFPVHPGVLTEGARTATAQAAYSTLGAARRILAVTGARGDGQATPVQEARGGRWSAKSLASGRVALGMAPDCCAERLCRTLDPQSRRA